VGFSLTFPVPHETMNNDAKTKNLMRLAPYAVIFNKASYHGMISWGKNFGGKNGL
jgi:hypothetical protein